ncbi:hypothetical protein BDV10DRAFT_179215 [Aspergillus recurvatus]
MTRGCRYNCEQHPLTIEADSDITGDGVLVDYIATAGIAIILTTAHYFFAYESTLDPFRDEHGVPCSRAVPFRPNPVDCLFCDTREGSPRLTLLYSRLRVRCVYRICLPTHD